MKESEPYLKWYIGTLGIALFVMIHALYISLYSASPTRWSDAAQIVAGWLTPLALAWFVATVMLQRKELEAQREELQATREEHKENRIASQQYAAAMDLSSKAQMKQTFLDMLKHIDEGFLFDAASIKAYMEYSHSNDENNVVPLKIMDTYSQYIDDPSKLYREIASQLPSFSDNGDKWSANFNKYQIKISSTIDRTLVRRDHLLEQCKNNDLDFLGHDIIYHSSLSTYITVLTSWRKNNG